MGRGRWFSIPKDEISLLEIRSKIERQGVQNRKVEWLSYFFYAENFKFSIFFLHLPSVAEPMLIIR